MNKYLKKVNYNFICFMNIMIFVFLSIMGSFFIYKNIIGTLIYSYFIMFFGITSLIIYVYGLIKKKTKINIYDIFIYLLIIFAIISTVFAFKTDVALLGTTNRNEGLFVILSYYFLFLNSKNITKVDAKKIIYLILSLGIINIIVGLAQVVNFWVGDSSLLGAWYYAKGFLGNSNFFGTYMVICFGLSYGLLFKEKINYKKIIIFIIFCIGIIISGCMSAYVGVFFIILLSIFYLFFNKKEKKNNIKIISIGVVVLILIYLIFANCLIKTLNKDIFALANDTKSVVSNNANQNAGTGRIYIWKNTLRWVPNNWANGVGIDNFLYAFGGTYLQNDKEIFDKAHNEYLQILITEGVFAVTIYVFFLLYVFFNNLKTIKKNNYQLALMMAFMGYAIQAFFNISVIRDAPIFFIIMGLLIYGDNNE